MFVCVCVCHGVCVCLKALPIPRYTSYSVFRLASLYSANSCIFKLILPQFSRHQRLQYESADSLNSLLGAFSSMSTAHILALLNPTDWNKRAVVRRRALNLTFGNKVDWMGVSVKGLWWLQTLRKRQIWLSKLGLMQRHGVGGTTRIVAFCSWIKRTGLISLQSVGPLAVQTSP